MVSIRKQDNYPKPIHIPIPFAVGAVNGWLLLGDEPALVDVGPRTDEAWEALVAGLASYGLQPRDLHHIFVTHAHVDHYGNAARLAEAAPHATLYAPDVAQARSTFLDLEEEWERKVAFNEVVLRLSGLPERVVSRSWKGIKAIRSFAEPVPVTRWVKPGERLALGDGREWEVVYLPGHSMTQVGLWLVESHLFLSADHLLPHISSNALLEPPLPGESRRPRALLQYIKTLKWTAQLAPQHIFPGHGEYFFDQRPLIKHRLQKIEKRAAHLYEALSERPCSVIELVNHLFPQLRRGETFLAISEVVGHLDLLVTRQQVAFRAEKVREYYVINE